MIILAKNSISLCSKALFCYAQKRNDPNTRKILHLRRKYATIDDVKTDLYRYIELFYNRKPSAELQAGPLYAQYRHVDGGAHMVVICGVSYEEGLVYTCNPWGIHGVQTFDEFLNHPTGNKWQTWGWNLECVYDVQN